MAAGVIARLLANIRRRNRLRTATIAMYNSGMCQYVTVRDGVLVHRCAEDHPRYCPWIEARRVIDEEIGAW